MRLQGLTYPIGAILLVLLFALNTVEGGYRLPRYYTPDGILIPLGKQQSNSRARVLYEIDGRSPAASPALFDEPGRVVVVTDLGVGLMPLVPNNTWQVLFDFKLPILFTFIWLFGGIWFFSSTRDLHLTAFALVLASFLFTTVTTLGFHRLQFAWHVNGLVLIPVLLNLGLRTTGKEVSGFLIVGELLVVLFLALIAYVGLDSTTTLKNLKDLAYLLFLLAVAAVAGLQLDNAIRPTRDPVEKFKRWTLLGGTVVGLIVPFALFLVVSYVALPAIDLEYAILASVCFPAALVYGTYRIHLLPFQLIVTRSLVAGLLTVLLIGIYGIALLTHSMLLPEQEGQYEWIVNVFFVLVLVFFLDPARRQLSRFIEKRALRLDANLSESLKRIANIISEHRRVQPAVDTFLEEIHRTIAVDRVSFLFSSASFPELQIRGGLIKRISHTSDLWRHLSPGRLAVTAYLTYGGGSRQELFNFLYKNQFLLAIGIMGDDLRRERFLRWPLALTGVGESGPGDGTAGIRVALLVGYPSDRRKLRLKEVRYLQEAAKLAGMLIQNYSLLVQEIAKRRRVREVFLAGQMQRSLPALDREPGPQGVEIAHFSEAAISVTGDYLDLIPVDRKSFALFLADVSGHGLGTGYIVSAIRAIVRSHLGHGAGLLATVQTLNLFLMDRYQGSEFITLFALILQTETGEMEFINAAHPGPFLQRGSGFTQLDQTQRIVGVLPTPYHSQRMRLQPNDRLFLYSDGITETFNRAEVAFGESGLREFLENHSKSDAPEITVALRQKLSEFRQGRAQSDDITFVALTYAPRLGPLRGLLSALGLDRSASTP